jgi:hypothetical protein
VLFNVTARCLRHVRTRVPRFWSRLANLNGEFGAVLRAVA